jgi:GNAT superfamily N-acetyltransferase
VSFTVRPGLAADADAVAALADEFVAYMRGLGDTADAEFSAQTYRRDGFGANPAFYCLVAEQSAAVVGYVIYHYGYDVDMAARTLTIVDFFVTEACRGQGAGKALMEAAKRVCREQGIPEILWSVYKRNPKAHPFYEHLGGQYITDEDFMYLEVDAGDGDG